MWQLYIYIRLIIYNIHIILVIVIGSDFLPGKVSLYTYTCRFTYSLKLRTMDRIRVIRILLKIQCAIKYDTSTCVLAVAIQTYGNPRSGGLIIIKIKIRKTVDSGGGGGGGQECGVMRTEVTRWYGGGGIGGHVGLMVNIMLENLNRVWTGGTVFFRQPTDQQSLVRFFDIVL